MPTVSGKCLCGTVKFTTELKEKVFDACHCSMCRRWAGSPLMTVDGSGGVKFTGEQNITVYDSSEWAQRAFCKTCGSNLYYKLKAGNLMAVPFGLLDDQSGYKFHVQIFVDHKPDGYTFANKTEMMTEAQVLAKFGGN